MKGYAMLKIGESGWIEKERPKCGPMDAICRGRKTVQSEE